MLPGRRDSWARTARALFSWPRVEHAPAALQPAVKNEEQYDERDEGEIPPVSRRRRLRRQNSQLTRSRSGFTRRAHLDIDVPRTGARQMNVRRIEQLIRRLGVRCRSNDLYNVAGLRLLQVQIYAGVLNRGAASCLLNHHA